MQDTGIHKRGKIVMRLLLIVDVMAPRRLGMTVQEITSEIYERSGERFSEKTIRRDLQAIHECGYVEKQRTLNCQGRGGVDKWRLNIISTQYLQKIACKGLTK